MEDEPQDKSKRITRELSMDEIAEDLRDFLANEKQGQKHEDSVWNTPATFIKTEYKIRTTTTTTSRTANSSELLAERKRRELENAIKENLIKPMPAPEDVSEPIPPAKAKSFLRFLIKAKDREVVIGDLAERYGKKVQQRGKLRADFWYYKQVVCSMYPLLHYAITKLRRLGAAR